MTERRTGKTICVLCMAVAFANLAADWPRWRGADQNAVSPETEWSAAWPEDGPKRLWEANLTRSCSSLVVAQGKLLTIGSTGGQNETIYCLDAETGKPLWTHAYDMSLPRHRSVSGGPTPNVVGQFVYTFGNGADLHCLELATGRVVWRNSLAETVDTGSVPYGYCASPAVAGGVVVAPIFPGIGQGKRGAGPYPAEKGQLIGVSTKTGKEVWRVSQTASAWSSPIVARLGGRKVVVHASGHRVICVEPVAGKLLWTFDAQAAGLRGDFKAGDLCATPLIVDDRVIFAAERRNAIVCLTIKDNKPTVAWQTNAISDWVQSLSVWNGSVYGRGRGGLAWLDVKTGRSRGQTGLVRTGNFIIAGGRVLAIGRRGREGVLSVLDLTGKLPKLLATAQVLDKDTAPWPLVAIPVLANGRIYCRNTAGHIVCLDVRPPKDD
jgi:outer membrane protein assembly factor BamB